jgi:bacterial/archaeal transporter family-2 protein
MVYLVPVPVRLRRILYDERRPRSVVNSLYIVLALVTGAGVAVQSLINARLRVVLGGPFWAAIGQFVVGLALLILLAALTRQPSPTFDEVPRTPWWVWTGGAFGATFIVVSIVLTPRMGTALTLSAITVGQLLMALVLDHNGWLGGPEIKLSPMRLLGAAMLLGGILLMRAKT